jgi:hypothetical protein
VATLPLHSAFVRHPAASIAIKVNKGKKLGGGMNRNGKIRQIGELLPIHNSQSRAGNALGFLKKMAKVMKTQDVPVDNQRLAQAMLDRFQFFHSFSRITNVCRFCLRWP